MSLNEGMVEAADRRGLRLRRSCELCRSSKGRCVPSEEDSSRCQRCLRDGKQCIFLEPKPRPKRAKSSRLRVAEMEEKLDGLMALLSSGKADKSVPAPSQPHPYPSPAESDLSPPDYNIGSTVPPGFLEFIASSPNSKLSQHQAFSTFPLYPSFERLHDVISQGIIEFQQAEECVQIFKSKAHIFPFVVISPLMSLDTLRREKPFLLLAVLAFATDANARLQARLELELRETMSRKIIVNGEKSIDLLQGVLVYLSSYHFFFDIEKQQVYQLCQMAAAMSIDLGLHKNIVKSQVKSTLLMIGLPTYLSPRVSEEELEARRTYVGCYYITSSLSQTLRKPNILKSSDYLEECAESLAAAAHNDTDYLMPHFVHMQRLSDEVNRAFDYDGCSQLPSLDAVRVEVLVQAFQQRFNHLQTVLPEKALQNLSLKTAFYKLRIYINEIGFHASPPSDGEWTMSDQSSLQSWFYSIERSNCLTNCSMATKEFLDQVLALTDCEFLEFTLLEYIYLIYAVLILGSFATKGNDQMLNAAHTCKSAGFEYYVKEVSVKIKHVIATAKGASSNMCLNQLDGLLQQSQMWYKQMTLDPTSPNVSKNGRPEYSFMQILPTITSHCVDFEFVGSGVSSSLSDEMWNDMISGAPLEPSFLTMDHSL